MWSILSFALYVCSLFFPASSLLAQPDYFFNSEEGKFSIQFPAEYMVNVEEKSSIKVLQASCLLNNHNFMATYTLHTVEMVDHEAMTDTFITTFGESINGKLLSKNEWTLDGKKGRKATYLLEEQGIKMSTE